MSPPKHLPHGFTYLLLSFWQLHQQATRPLKHARLILVVIRCPLDVVAPSADLRGISHGHFPRPGLEKIHKKLGFKKKETGRMTSKCFWPNNKGMWHKQLTMCESCSGCSGLIPRFVHVLFFRFANLSKTPNKKDFKQKLPETNMAFERKVVSQPSFSRGYVSFREGTFPAKVESFDPVIWWESDSSHPIYSMRFSSDVTSLPAL